MNTENKQAAIPQLFNFNDADVRVAELEGNPWFVAADVCAILGIANTTNATRRLDASEVTLLQIKGQRGLPRNCVSESGLYKLVMRSEKPEAKAFQDWVTKVVLPAIHKDGGYVYGEELLATGEMAVQWYHRA